MRALALPFVAALVAVAAVPAHVGSAEGEVTVTSVGAPLRVDPTGTTTQPATGAVAWNQGSAALLGGAWYGKWSDGSSHTAAVAASGLVAGLFLPPSGLSEVKGSSLPAGGVVIKHVAGVAIGSRGIINSSGSLVFLQVFCANTTPPANGTQPDDVLSAAPLPTVAQSPTWGASTYGLPCHGGIVFIGSSTATTYSPTAVTAVSWTFQYY